MDPRPLKVYYCNDCGCRMPLYYKKDQPVRDDTWRRCYKCKSSNITSQIEVWDWEREELAKEAANQEALAKIRSSATLWRDYQKQQASAMAESDKKKNDDWPY